MTNNDWEFEREIDGFVRDFEVAGRSLEIRGMCLHSPYDIDSCKIRMSDCASMVVVHSGNLFPAIKLAAFNKFVESGFLNNSQKNEYVDRAILTGVFVDLYEDRESYSASIECDLLNRPDISVSVYFSFPNEIEETELVSIGG